MGRIASVLGPAVVPGVAVVALVALAGCSSGHKSSTPPATTTTSQTAPVSSTTGASSTTAPTTVGPVSTTAASTGPPTTTGGSGAKITSFTVSPPSPVVCNAPTEIELKWIATGATQVALAIDGRHFATFGGGPQDHLEYFACDGSPHTYLLTAGTASVSKVVTSKTG